MKLWQNFLVFHPQSLNKGLSPKLLWNKSRLGFRFEGSCLKQEDIAPLTPKNLVNVFIVFGLDRCSPHLYVEFPLNDCLLGTAMITRNADPDKYKYITYVIGFNSRWQLFLPDDSMNKNVVIFRVNINSSTYTDN